MNSECFLAFDLGAESGRTMLGNLSDGRIEIHELNRFPTGYVNLNGTFVWNILNFYESMKDGLRKCASEAAVDLTGIGIDTWGVDFVLLDRLGNMLGMPISYRDKRTDGIMEEFFKIMPREELYRRTGTQVIQINTLFQLFSMRKAGLPYLDVADTLLFIPDYLTYLFSGEKVCEFSIASTSQMYDPFKSDWNNDVLEAASIPRSILLNITPTGRVVSQLSQHICKETGMNPSPVIATTGHDTASAVAAVPASGKDWVYISSGTWSLMGIESDVPIVSQKSYEYNFSNEGGVGHTFRVLKNIMGLWLVQQCRRSWSRVKDYSYGELTDMAKESEPFRSIIDPDYSAFLNPDDMPTEIERYCMMTRQPIPEHPGQFVRCILESLALKYRMVLDQIREINPSQSYNRVHIIGGGTQNELLSQFAANATNVKVIAGPVESTAVGNMLVQGLATGAVRSRNEIRDIVRNSFDLSVYEPQDIDSWNSAYQRFCGLLNSGGKIG